MVHQQGPNIYSADEDDEDGEFQGDLFAAGQMCDVCGAEEGRVGLDPTCRGAYQGDPVFYGFKCLPDGLKQAYAAVEGVAVLIEPFDEWSELYYYRLDEMPAYQFVREDVEAISWLMLTIGDECARCGEQSRFALLTKEFVDQKLPEDRQVFRNLDRNIEHLCGDCAAAHLADVYKALRVRLVTAEVPRGAMGIVMPTGE